MYIFGMHAPWFSKPKNRDNNRKVDLVAKKLYSFKVMDFTFFSNLGIEIHDTIFCEKHFKIIMIDFFRCLV